MPKEPNVLQQDEITPLKKERPIHPGDFTQGFVTQRMVQDVVVKFGVAADIPDGSTHTKAYFATDTGVLSMWDGTQWLSTTLS